MQPRQMKWLVRGCYNNFVPRGVHRNRDVLVPASAIDGFFDFSAFLDILALHISVSVHRRNTRSRNFRFKQDHNILARVPIEKPVKSTGALGFLMAGGDQRNLWRKTV